MTTRTTYTIINHLKQNLKFHSYISKTTGLLLCLLFVCYYPHVLQAQKPVTKYFLETKVANPQTSILSVNGYPVIAAANFDVNYAYNMYFARKADNTIGMERIVTAFEAGGHKFIPHNSQTSGNSFTKVVFKRKNPETGIVGEKYAALYEYNAILNSAGTSIATPSVVYPLPTGSSIYFEPSFVADLENFMNSYSLAKGTDNVFVNDAANNNTSNNIERIDLVYAGGVIANTVAQRELLGFLLNERGGNDNFKVAAITGINADNDVTALGTLKEFSSSVWGAVGPEINTIVIQKKATESTYRPSQVIATQTVSGVFLTLASLDIPVNSMIYGISIFPQDATTSKDLLFLTDANTNTNSNSGLDLMSGNFAAKAEILLYPNLEGTVFHDANGLAGTPVNTVDGTPIGNPSGIQLHANLLDHNGIVVASVPVNTTTGKYLFENVAPGNYTIQLSSIIGTVLSPAPDKLLPIGWINTGESNNGLGTLSDGTPNGILSVTVAAVDIINLNFGIEQPPNSDNKSQVIPQPSGSTITAGTATTHVSGTDPEDGALGNTHTIVITKLADNGVMYYDGQPVTLNQQINGFDPTKLSFTGLAGGSMATQFEYAFVDAALVKDPTPATYTLTWSAPLPVLFGTINASITNGELTVNFITEKEINNNHFDIEASNDGIIFTTIGTLQSKAENGNSNNSIHYQFRTTGAGLLGLTGSLLVLVAGTLLAAYKREFKILRATALGMALVVSISIFSACNKQDTRIADAGNKKLWIRIVQVDTDGKKAYSKVMQTTIN